ncbi:hypothetical protein MINS_01230 [Mycolicibacterium insubricum]|nr:hypothetical protein MINS_01230 [Mycolicibacterium insubricum]
MREHHWRITAPTGLDDPQPDPIARHESFGEPGHRASQTHPAGKLHQVGTGARLYGGSLKIP